MFEIKNYGDEKPAVALLFPEKYSDRGLGEQDFLRLRSKNEVYKYSQLGQIKSIFESIGYKYGAGKFEAIFSRAKQIVNLKLISSNEMMKWYL